MTRLSRAHFVGGGGRELPPPWAAPRVKEGVVRIVGPNFTVRLSVRDGKVAAADRSVSYMKGWPLQRVLALAERWHWKVEFNDTERQASRDAVIALNDSQLEIVMSLARPLSPGQRDLFLQAVPRRLVGVEVGDGTVTVAAQREVINGAALRG